MDTILGLIRHILTFGGGTLASKGYIEASEVELIVGAVVTIVGAIWSAFDKYSKKKALEVAKA